MRTVTLDGAPVGPFAGSYDLFGDGRLVIVPTPGHTPGHVGMIVRGATRRWLLAGDLVHDPRELARSVSADRSLVRDGASRC